MGASCSPCSCDNAQKAEFEKPAPVGLRSAARSKRHIYQDRGTILDYRLGQAGTGPGYRDPYEEEAWAALQVPRPPAASQLVTENAVLHAELQEMKRSSSNFSVELQRVSSQNESLKRQIEEMSNEFVRAQVRVSNAEGDVLNAAWRTWAAQRLMNAPGSRVGQAPLGATPSPGNLAFVGHSSTAGVGRMPAPLQTMVIHPPAPKVARSLSPVHHVTRAPSPVQISVVPRSPSPTHHCKSQMEPLLPSSGDHSQTAGFDATRAPYSMPWRSSSVSPRLPHRKKSLATESTASGSGSGSAI